MKHVVVFLLMVWCTTSTAWARDLYVNSVDGSDADDGLTWATAKATVEGALAIDAAGDTIYVSDNHAETAAAAKTWTLPTTPGERILCADDAAEPPTALATTCTVTTTGNNAVTIPGGFAYIYGITFNSGTGASGASDLIIAGSTVAVGMVFDTCVFNNVSTSTSAPMFIGQNGAGTNDDVLVEFRNCDISFGNVSQEITMRNGRFHFIDLALTGATAPGTLFQNTSSSDSQVFVESSDLSGLAFTNLVNVSGAATSNYLIRNSKLPTSIVVATGTFAGPGDAVVRLHNCDSADTNYRFAEHKFEGSVVNETTIVRTGGASDGTTPISWKMDANGTTQASGFWHPLESPEIVQWNETTGSAKTITVEFITDSVANINDDQVWLETDCLATSGFPQGTRGTDRKADILAAAAAQTDSTATWTTTGLTNPNTQKLDVTCTPAEKGYIHARVYVSGPLVVYADPLMTIQ